MHYLTTALAASDVIHGELLDISGIGVLLIGESGIGKSETALELVHRGHMLVADDLVEVKRIKNKIYGYPPKRISNLLEVRGVGLIDVEAMYGVGGVLNQKRIHLVIEMEQWDDSKSYDRLGNENLTYDILGVKFQRVVVPVSAGRNLAVVIEAASRNFRLKSMGRDALELASDAGNADVVRLLLSLRGGSPSALGTGRQEHLDDLGEPGLRRIMHRGASVIVGGVGVRPALEEQRDEVVASVAGGQD